MGVESIGGYVPPAQVDQTQANASTDQVQAAAKDVASLLGGQSLNVTGTAGLTLGAKIEIGVPELDEAELESLDSVNEDLAQLIALLTLENDEVQAEQVQKRIKSLVDKIQAKHDEVSRKLDESINKAVEQAKSNKRNKILGWLMTALTVIAAVIATVATCGAGLGGAALAVGVVGCVCAGLGAAMSLTMSILNETGGMEKIRTHFAHQYMKDDPSLTESEAKALFDKRFGIGMAIAQGILALGSLGTGIASAAIGGGKTLHAALRIAQIAVTTANTIVGGVSAGFQWSSLFLNKEAAELQAELKELQAVIDKLNALLETEQDALVKLLQEMQSCLSVITELVEADSQIQEDILGNFGVQG